MPTRTDSWQRYGSCLFIIAAVEFIIGMIIAQAYFPCNSNGCYNVLTNPISDLGNTVLSSLWPVFNYSLVFFGILLFAGVILISGALRPGRLGSAGIFILAIAALGSAGVGVVPENTYLSIHSAFALIAFVGAGLGLLLIGLNQGRKAWDWYAIYSLVSGVFTLVAIAVFLFGPTWVHYGNGFGFGGIERMVAFPEILWILVTGLLFYRKR